MKRQRTLAQYQGVDLTLFAVILGICEYAVTRAAGSWFPGQLYTVSLTATVCAIVLMRWGAWAGLHALLGGAVFWLASGGSGAQLAIYALGNLGCLLLLPLLGRDWKERIRSDMLFTARPPIPIGGAAALLTFGVCELIFTGSAFGALYALLFLYDGILYLISGRRFGVTFSLALILYIL